MKQAALADEEKGKALAEKEKASERKRRKAQEKEDAKAGQKPRHHKMTKLDIPELNIHQQMEDNGEDDVRSNYVKRNVSVMCSVSNTC